MRALLVLAPLVAACTSENVQPLAAFGPMSAAISVELGPLSSEFGRDVNDRVNVSFSHSNPQCPVFDDAIDVSIDGVRPSSLEVGYYDEGGGYGHDTSAYCQPPYFGIHRVPPAQPRSVLRLVDATADLSLEVDRLFVNPTLSLATPLVRGQLARIEVADDRLITKVSALWMMGDETESIGYDVMATVAANVISFRMPSNVTGTGWLEVRFDLAAPELTCNGFSACTVLMSGSARIEGTLQ